MTRHTSMEVILRVPASILFSGSVHKLTAVAGKGSFGLLPNHVDLVTDLVPSIMVMTLTDGTERYVGIDEGLLVKQSQHVSIVVRRAVQSNDLDTLSQTVSDTFIDAKDEECVARTALSHLEARMVRRFIKLRAPAS